MNKKDPKNVIKEKSVKFAITIVYLLKYEITSSTLELV